MTAGSSFSRLYVERAAREHELTGRILTRLSGLPVVEIDDYQELFSRPRQSFSAQKRMPSLILAVKAGHFLYKGSERINSWQQETVYYNDLIRNCIYDCEYCFLQGMHSSAHSVINVNVDDYIEEARRAAVDAGKLFLSISYLTDLLGFEPIVPFTRRWIEVAREEPKLELEIRTKSDNYPALRDMEPAANVLFVWSLAPERISASIEHGTASFRNRLFAARSALERGFRVRLCFDPVLMGPGWEDEYRKCIAETFRRLPADRIELVSVGGLRMGGEQLARLAKDNPARSVMFHPAVRENGLIGYPPEIESRIRELLGRELRRYLPADRILFLTAQEPNAVRRMRPAVPGGSGSATADSRPS